MNSLDNTLTLNTEGISDSIKTTLRGELVLMFAVIINSLGVVLMLYSGTGISAISSVPYAFSEVFPAISLGTFTYIFQGLLVCSLMILRKKFVPSYLFSFVVGFIFGECIDLHNLWIPMLPTGIGFRIMYFIISYCLISLGIGTIVAAFTMGKAIGLVGRWLDKKFDFVSFMKN